MTPTAHLRIHQFAGLQPGPRLLVTGAVHGNEVHGTKAMAELIRQLDARELTLRRGTLTLVPVVNALAHQLDRREGDRNLTDVGEYPHRVCQRPTHPRFDPEQSLVR